MGKCSPFMESIRAAIRVRHYARSTEKAYLYWTRHFIRFHNYRHPKDMHTPEIVEFLTHLAVKRKVSPSTQNQALNALLFVYRHVLDAPIDNLTDATRAKQKKRIPVVLTRSEVNALLSQLDGLQWLVASLRWI